MLDYRVVDYEHAEYFRPRISLHFRHWDPQGYEWLWKHVPGGSLQLLAYHDTNMIGHYGFLPLTFIIDETSCTGAKAEGSFIELTYTGNQVSQYHPEVGDRRVFQELVAEALAVALKRYDFIFGFPNQAATKAQVNAGYGLWDTPVSTYVKIMSRVKYKFQRMAQRVPIVETWLRTQAKNKLKSYEQMSIDHIPMQAINQLHSNMALNRIEYNASYLNWRIINNPHGYNSIYWINDPATKNMLGYAIFSLRVGTGGFIQLNINDIKVDSKLGKTTSLLRALTDDLQNKFQPDLIRFWCNKNELYADRHIALKEMGFGFTEGTKAILVKAAKYADLDSASFDINLMWTEGA